MLLYEQELEMLQIELVRLQRWVQETQQRILILFEGRDTAGKGGAIFRFTHHLNPRAMRVIALPKPTEVEKGQWYFQRYAVHLPNPGEIVFFDRSWYNRAVVEPVMGFCTKAQYELFLKQVPGFEQMLIDDGIRLIKFWFSIDIAEQKRRLLDRQINPLKQWKISTVDMQAQQRWHEFTVYKESMFLATHNEESPWMVVRGNDKEKARLEAIRYVLSQIDFPDRGRTGVSLKVNHDIVQAFDPELHLMVPPSQLHHPHH